MVNVYDVGQDDNGWTLDVLCADAAGPVELSDASSILAYLSRFDGSAGLDALTCTAVADYAFPGNPGTSGKDCIARHVGTATEAATPGLYKGRIQVTWADGSVRSFPTTQQYFQVRITERP